MRNPLSLLGLVVFLILVEMASGEGLQLADVADMESRSMLKDRGFETLAPGVWDPWQKGFDPERTGPRSGNQCARCVSSDLNAQHGVGQTVVLDQENPEPIRASGWSRCRDVNGLPGSGYSIYLDLTFQDGSSLWGQFVPFDTGTHDWQRKEKVIFPAKPIRELRIYGLLRGITGTAFFDDFDLEVLHPPDGMVLFDSLRVVGETSRSVSVDQAIPLAVPGGPGLDLDPRSAAVRLSHPEFQGPWQAASGFMVRDLRDGAHAIQAFRGVTSSTQDGASFKGMTPNQGLQLTATYRTLRGRVLIDAAIEDPALDEGSRFITLYFLLPLDAVGATWHDDMRRHRIIEKGGEYSVSMNAGAGSNGSHSLYPLALISRDQTSLVLGTPLEPPRYQRIAYNSAMNLFWVGFDVALSPRPVASPSRAEFQVCLMSSSGAEGFRGGLKTYYDCFPEAFEKRVPRQGLWMPFADIATVKGFEDFHFAFQEGATNPLWDEQHGILSFPYVEPMTKWVTLPKEVERTYEATLEHVSKMIGSEMPEALASAAKEQDGRLSVAILNAPWCDGAVFTMNGSSALPMHAGRRSIGRLRMDTLIETVDSHQGPQPEAWEDRGVGVRLDTTEAQEGETSLLLERPIGGQDKDALCTVLLEQKEPRRIEVSCWAKGRDILGTPDKDYALYVDLIHEDGTPSWGHVAELPCKDSPWQKVTLNITPQKPVRVAYVHLLLRGCHFGQAWFDDVVLIEGDAADNRLPNGSFEKPLARTPEIDGVYVDSLEGWKGVKNFNDEQFEDAQEPLLFDEQGAGPFILTIFSTYEFCKELKTEMRKRGKFTFANAALWEFSFMAPLFDIMGTETNWKPSGQWTPDSDETCCFRRSLCYQKPYCLLQNTQFEDWTGEDTDRYIRRCLFYGFFPGMFSVDAASHAYFTEPLWYERDRGLYARFMPILIRIAEAGWEPVTCARSDREDVWLERYGPSDDAVYVTCLNASKEPRDISVEVDLDRLGTPKMNNVAELLDGSVVSSTRRGRLLVFKDHLAPEECHAYALTP